MRVFVSGFGTIGKRVVELFYLKKPDFQKRFSELLSVVGVMDSKSYEVDDKEICSLCVLGNKIDTGKCGHHDRKGKKGVDILKMVDFDVLIECSPTNIKDGGEGLENIRYALSKGKDVITVNKGPLALEFKELGKLAQKNGCVFRYEGTVGGGMPIINLCKEGMAGQKIKSIQGIFNGTCNYILSKMDTGIPFDQALKEAQQLGYAETDPTYDIKGIDCACKVAILANSIFGKNITVNDVELTGIDSITDDAIMMASQRGMVIRLIGEVSEGKFEASPRLIPMGHPLSVKGTTNVAVINTELAGPIIVSGAGAGGSETASAIISDLIFIMEKRTNQVKK